jgi:hypothetical protein
LISVPKKPVDKGIKRIQLKRTTSADPREFDKKKLPPSYLNASVEEYPKDEKQEQKRGTFNVKNNFLY